MRHTKIYIYLTKLYYRKLKVGDARYSLKPKIAKMILQL